MEPSDPLETGAILVTCRNVPPELMEANRAKEFFRKYGPITKMRIRINSMKILIYYDSIESANRAVAEAGNYYGQKFLVSLGSHRPKTRKSLMTGDQDVLAELNAHRSYAHVEDAHERKLARIKQQKTKIFAKPGLIKSPATARLTKNADTQSSKAWTQEQLDLLKILKQQTTTDEEKYRVLDARDKLIRLRNKKSTDISKAKHTIGTCSDMCPEKERLMRVVQHQVASYEQDLSNKQMVPQLAVKQYSRSSADQEAPLPHDLRPVSVLQMTMNYLMQEVMNDCDCDDVNLADWYHFMWDRTRAIRKDITQQELCCQGSVTLVEQCARFHIHCSARLAGEDPSVFDQKINTENLTKCLQSLKYMYHDLSLKGIRCPNEPEFRAYIILLNLNDGNFMWEVQELEHNIQKSPEVRFALEVYSCIDKNNYVRFFKLVKSTTYLNACILLRYFIQVRHRALETIVRCYSPRNMYTQYPVEELCDLLAFEDIQAAEMFLEAYNMSLNQEGTHVVLDKRAFSMPEIPIGLDRAINVIESKRTTSVGEVVCGNHLPEKNYIRHIPHSSFDTNGYLKINLFFPDVDNIKLSAKDVVDGDSGVKGNLFTANKFGENVAEEEPKPVWGGAKNMQNTTTHFFKPPVENEKPQVIGGFKFDLKQTTTSSSTSLFSNSNVQQTSAPNSIFGERKLVFGDVEKNQNGAQVQQKQPFSSAPTSQPSFRFTLSPQQTTNKFFAKNISIQETKYKLEEEMEEKTQMLQKLKEQKELLEKKRKEEYEKRKQQEEQRLREEKQRQEAIRLQEEQARQLEERRQQEAKRMQEAKRLQEEKMRQQALQIQEEKRRQEEARRKLEKEQKDMENRRLEEQRRLQREKEIQQTIFNLMDDLLTKVVEKCMNDRLAEIRKNIQAVKLKNFISKWKNFVEEQKTKRKSIHNALWSAGLRPDEEAKELYSQSQAETLANIKRYKIGVPKLFGFQPEKTLPPLDVFKLIYPNLVNVLSLQNCLSKEIFWKCIVSIPNGSEVELNDLNKDISDLLEIQTENESVLKSKKTILGDLFTYVIEKLVGVQTKKGRDFDGVIVVTKNMNKYFVDRLSELLKNNTKLYSPPVYIIIEEPMHNIESFQQFLREKSVKHYKIVCSALYPQSLSDTLTNGLKFLANNLPLQPNLELEYLNDYLTQTLGTELWTRIRAMGDFNLPFKHCLTKPKIVVNLYNEALDKIKEIIFKPDYALHKNFASNFANIASQIKPDLTPFDYKHFPAYWCSVEYKKVLENTLTSLKLPDYEAIWPPKEQKDLEQVVYDYCAKVFEHPIPKFYIIMAKILKFVSESFDNIKTFDWTTVIEIIASEKIQELNCNLDKSKFHGDYDELFVIYDKKDLKQYMEDYWFYLNNELIKKELDFKLDAACATEEEEEELEEVIVVSPQKQVRKRKYSESCLDLFSGDFDLDETFRKLFNSSPKSNIIRKRKAEIENVKRMLDDLDESIQISKKINEKMDNAIHHLFE